MKASDERRPVRYEPAYATGVFYNMISHQSQVISESISNVFHLHIAALAKAFMFSTSRTSERPLMAAVTPNAKCVYHLMKQSFHQIIFLLQSELILKFLQSFSHGNNFLPGRDFGIKQLALNPIYVAYSVCGACK